MERKRWMISAVMALALLGCGSKEAAPPEATHGTLRTSSYEEAKETRMAWALWFKQVAETTRGGASYSTCEGLTELVEEAPPNRFDDDVINTQLYVAKKTLREGALACLEGDLTAAARHLDRASGFIDAAWAQCQLSDCRPGRYLTPSA